MKTLGIILLCSNCFGTYHSWDWHWYFPFFFFFMFLLICFMFRGWRRRNYSCGWSGWSGHRDYNKTEAKEILKKRYAKGDISKEEFDNMMSEIS